MAYIIGSMNDLMTFWAFWPLILMDSFFCCTLFNIVWIKDSQIIANHLIPPLISKNFFSILTKSFWNQYLWFLWVESRLVQSLCQTTADLHKKNPRATAVRLKEGVGVYHRSLALSLISNFDPWSLSSFYPPCVKGPERTFSLMRTVLRGDTKSYKINTSKPLLSKLWFWLCDSTSCENAASSKNFYGFR